MCWSAEGSAAIAIGGLSSAFFLWKKGQPREIWLPTAYFVLMEGLQAITYAWLNECGTTMNMVLTYIAMIHISFQPFFINMLGMAFIDKKVKAKIYKYVYLVCGITAIACLARLLPLYDVLGRCELGTAICSHETTCAYRGQWHIGWNVLMNGFNENWKWYVFTAFIVPIFYGSWKWSLYHYIVGPFLASLTTSDVNERPAVWCLFSTMIIAMMVNTPIRKFIYVKRWVTWKWIIGVSAPVPEEDTAVTQAP